MAGSTSVVITGASGLLGRAIHAEFLAGSSCKYQVVGLCHQRQKLGLIPCDLTNKQAVQRLFTEYKPKVVIHAAAERKPDVVEKNEEQTKELNVSATEYLVAEATAANCFLLYISTDYVFDGTSPPYTTDSTPNPLNKYGMSKLEGEKIVLASKSKASSILRVPILYGEVENLDESAITTLFKVLQSDEAKNVDDYQRRYPTHVQDVAAVCRQLSDMYVKDVDKFDGGIFHWASTEDSVTKYDIVQEMAKIFSLPTHHILRDTGPPKPGSTPRPYDVKLDISRLKSIGLGKQTPFSDGIKQCLLPYAK